jgi:hypothetical protein
VASIQRQEEARRAPEGTRASQKRGSLNTANTWHRQAAVVGSRAPRDTTSTFRRSRSSNVPILIDSTKSRKSSKAPKADIWHKNGTKTFDYALTSTVADVSR